MKRKLMSAGAVITLALGVFAWRVAWATPSSGLTTAILAGPVVFEDVKLKSESEVNEVEIEMKGTSNVYIVHNVIDARFEFEEGKIRRHTDRFDLWRWAGMALGVPGKLLGWTPLLQNTIRRKAAAGLDEWIARAPR